MLFVVSPAKNLNVEAKVNVSEHTQPKLLADAEALIERCRELSPNEIGSLMKISDKLAGLNAARFAEWQTPFTEQNAMPSVFMFNGDVYTGLEAETLPSSVWSYAQQHMRILSGLYGSLKPLDLIQPYRLEMGTKLDNPRGSNLYQFWGDKVTDELNAALAEANSKVLVNLASNEYFKVVNKKRLNADVVTPVFKDTKNGELKVISFYAKKARGLMARFILENKPSSVKELQSFDAAGYYFNAELSNASELVFCRAEQ